MRIDCPKCGRQQTGKVCPWCPEEISSENVKETFEQLMSTYKLDGIPGLKVQLTIVVPEEYATPAIPTLIKNEWILSSADSG